MSRLATLLSRVRALFLGRRLDARLDEEVRAHLALLTADYERAGMSAADARLAARRAFGGVQQMTETHRDRRSFPWIDDVRRDVHHALRSLWRAPLFAAAAMLTLAVGISVAAAMFAILNAMLFRPMPVPHPEELVSISTTPDRHVALPHGLSFPDLEDYRRQQAVFTDLAGYTVLAGALDAGGGPERITLTSVTDNYFSLLGVEPAAGRLIRPGEGRARGDAPVLVLSHEFWQARFGGDPSIVGRAVRLNGRPFTIIGVTPRPFDDAQSLIRVAAFVPLWMQDELQSAPNGLSMVTSREAHQLWVLGRLRPGVTLEQAGASLRSRAAALAREHPDTNKDVSVIAVPETHARPNPNIGPFFRIAATALAALAGLLLLITSANVANLLMARAASRGRELSLRSALGAGRGRLVRQLLTESIVLASLAVIVAAPVAIVALGWIEDGFAASTALVSIRPHFAFDLRVAIGTFAMALAAGIAAGLTPSLFAARGDLVDALKSGGRHASRRSSGRLRSTLVVAQVALSLALLVSGGLFARSLDRARRVDLGFEPADLVTASVSPWQVGYDGGQRLRYYTDVRDRLRQLPGVERVSWVSWIPLGILASQATVSRDGEVRREEQAMRAMDAYIDLDYFATVGLPLVAGRAFDARDDASAPGVAIVNRTLAATLWPGQSPIGRFVNVGTGRVQIVGVVPDGKYIFVWEAPRSMLFRPLAQGSPQGATLVVRSRRPSAEVVADMRSTLRAADASVPVFDAWSMEEHLNRQAGGFLAFHLGVRVSSIVGALGLLLASIGLYGMIAGHVSQRTQEIGIRIALGARAPAILRDVLGRGIRLALIGIVVGAALAALVAQGVRALLLDVSPYDPLIYGAVSVFLLMVCLVAALVPALRATSIDPIGTLRSE